MKSDMDAGVVQDIAKEKSMKLGQLILVMGLLLTGVANAQTPAPSQDRCAVVYGDGTEKMLIAIEDFKSHRINNIELAGRAAAVSTEVRSVRAACAVFDEPTKAEKQCIEGYLKLYNETRQKVRVIQMLKGEQTEVDSNIFNTFVIKMKLLNLDHSCGRRSVQ